MKFVLHLHGDRPSIKFCYPVPVFYARFKTRMAPFSYLDSGSFLTAQALRNVRATRALNFLLHDRIWSVLKTIKMAGRKNTKLVEPFVCKLGMRKSTGHMRYFRTSNRNFPFTFSTPEHFSFAHNCRRQSRAKDKSSRV